MISSAIATLDKLRAKMPRVSTMAALDHAPVYGTRPNVGFRPYIPVYAAGMRTEPPWSVPMAISTPSPRLILGLAADTSFKATTAAAPERLPPQVYPCSQ